MPRLSTPARQARRQTLIDAAWRCLEDGGYRAMTVDAVCAEAGVSKGGFYTYFDQKQDLLLALLDDDAAGLGEVVVDAARHPSGIDQVRRFAAGFVDRGSNATAVQLRADLWAEIAADQALQDRFLRATRERRAQLAGVVEQAVEAGDMAPVPANALAAVLLALGDGLMLHRALDPSGFKWANVRRAIDALLDGLRPDQNT